MFVDMEPPAIGLHGTPDTRVLQGAEYADAGAALTDNDPAYGGTIRSNATAVDTSRPGTYLIEYIAPPDAAGNMPESAVRTVTVYGHASPANSTAR